jgi:hypothetical protein
MATEPRHGYTASGEPVHAEVHDHHPSDTAYQRFNKRLAKGLTKRVGTMTTFWLFCCISVLSLPATLVLSRVIPARWVPPFVRTFGFSLLIAWICQNFIQLVLLPALMVGQNLQNQAADVRAAKTFEDVQDIKQDLKRIMGTLEES